MPKNQHAQSWPVKDVRYVEVALSDITTRHLHIEFDHGIRIVVAHDRQLPLAAKLIESLRHESNTLGKGGRS